MCSVCEEKDNWADTENRSLEVLSLYGVSFIHIILIIKQCILEIQIE